MNDELRRKIEHDLARIRKRRARLLTLSLTLAFVAFLLLVSARQFALDSGQFPWVLDLALLVCVGLAVAFMVGFERT